MDVPELITQHFSRPIPPLLWHYTKPQALNEIILSGSLWLTDVRYQADQAEFMHARTFLEEAWNKGRNRVVNETADKVMQELGPGADGSFYSLNNMQVFILSFTQLQDDLSQWRQYGDQCAGGSLGFDLRTIRAALSEDKFLLFAPCIYRDDDKARMFELVVNAFVDSFIDIEAETRDIAFLRGIERRERQLCRAIGEHFTSEHTEKALAKHLNGKIKEVSINWTKTVYRLAACCKQTQYAVEGEWRLTFAADPEHPELHNHVKHFDRSGVAVPYLSIPFSFEEGLKEIHLGSRFAQEVALNLALDGARVKPLIKRTNLQGC